MDFFLCFGTAQPIKPVPVPRAMPVVDPSLLNNTQEGNSCCEAHSPLKCKHNLFLLFNKDKTTFHWYVETFWLLWPEFFPFINEGLMRSRFNVFHSKGKRTATDKASGLKIKIQCKIILVEWTFNKNSCSLCVEIVLGFGLSVK